MTNCAQMYDKFTTGDVKGILEAAAENASMEIKADPSVPYAGKHTGVEALGKMFEAIGQAWGGPKGIAIAFAPHDFSTCQEGGKVENKVTIRQLTPGGNVILGEETHSWYILGSVLDLIGSQEWC